MKKQIFKEFTRTFDEFMRENNLWNDALSNKSNKQINNIFIKSKQ